MSGRQVIFLTEGSQTMGFGHLTRCVALSHAFLEKGCSSSFIVSGDDSIDVVLKHVNYEKYQWLKGVENISHRLKNSILIVDTFSISEEVLQEISNLTKVNIIDDFIRRDHRNSLVIDWTINSENKFYVNRNQSSFYLLGQKYIALRHPFWDCPRFSIKPLIENVLITFGGGDIRNLTPHVLNIIQKQYPLVMKTVIVGGGCQCLSIIKAMADARTNIILDADAETMLLNMINTDVAIASGGQTLYELACVGVPTISIALIDNQLDDINGWEESGFTIHSGWWDDINLDDNILSSLRYLESMDIRKRKSIIGQALVDGQGARRIVEFILEKNYDS